MDKIDWVFERVLWPIIKHVMGVTFMLCVICYVLVGLYEMGWIS